MPTENTTLQPKQEIFIQEMISHGNRRLAYQAAYSGTSNGSAHVGACRLLTNPEIARRIRQGLLEAQQQSILSIKEQYDSKLSDIMEKRAILAQIIRGELKSEKETTNKDGETVLIKTQSDPKERIQAIILDNKMEEEWRKATIIPDTDVVRYTF